MNNQFTTVISYEKPIQGQRSGSAIFVGDVGALLKALGFMALWLVLTTMLLAEPLMLNSHTASAKQGQQHFTLRVAPAMIEKNAQNNAAKHALQTVPAHLNAKLNAEPSSTELAPARLSYALLSVK
jgi:hypothetical protein